MTAPEPIDVSTLPPLLTVAETAELLRVGRRQCYRRIHEGIVPHVTIGNTIRVPTAKLLQLLGLGDERTFDRTARYADLDTDAALRAVQ